MKVNGGFVCALAALLGGTAVAAEPEMLRRLWVPSITVIGTGETQVPPNLAEIDVGVVTQAESAGEAVRRNSAAVQQFMTALQEAGIAPRDIQTSTFQVSPQYQHHPNGQQPPTIIGYQVINQVHVCVRQLDRLGDLLDQVVQQGVNQVQGIRFEVENPSRQRDQARRQAMKDARRQAELYAELAGARLGQVLLIDETPRNGDFPRPSMRMEMAADASVPISPGEQTLTVKVTVTYGLHAVGKEE